MIYRLLPNFLRKVYNKTVNDDCNCKHILYDYVLWNNTYEDKWYAIKREHMTSFFAGGKDREHVAIINGYYSSKSLSELYKTILDTHDGK